MFAALLSSTCIVRAITPRQVRAVLQAAFRAYPRLGSVRDDTVYLKGWSASRANQILYHNDSLLCCRVSIREISQRRALYQENKDPPEVPNQPQNAAPAGPAPPTPPGGRG